jgi:hypothetical protein
MRREGKRLIHKKVGCHGFSFFYYIFSIHYNDAEWDVEKNSMETHTHTHTLTSGG